MSKGTKRKREKKKIRRPFDLRSDLLQTVESSSARSKKKKNGLVNLGNTCWLNSLLQSFYAVPGFPEYVQSLEASGLEGPQSHLDEFLRNLKRVFQHLKLDFRRSPRLQLPESTYPIGLWKSLKRPSAQHDTHEKLMWILDALERVEKASPAHLKKALLMRDEESKEEPEENVQPQAHDLNAFFRGMTASKLKCPSCPYEGVTKEPFQALSLGLKKTKHGSGKVIELTKQLQLFFKPETLQVDWTCSECNNVGQPTKQLFLDVAPKNLILHLKRFEMDWVNDTINKIGKKVNFPVTALKLKTLDKKTVVYDLLAVVNHMGDLNSGHYVASCKDENGQWFSYDDEQASKVTTKAIVRKTAYILYYERRD